LFYSYDHGPVHVVVISTETNFTAGSKQWLWMDADLSAVDRAVTPFVIVSGHRPFYTSTLQEDKFGAALIEHVQPLLLKHRVDVYLSGGRPLYASNCLAASSCFAADCDAQGTCMRMNELAY
jgi:hypothetical protein